MVRVRSRTGASSPDCHYRGGRGRRSTKKCIYLSLEAVNSADGGAYLGCLGWSKEYGHAARSRGAPPQTGRGTACPAYRYRAHEWRGGPAGGLAPVEGEPDRDRRQRGETSRRAAAAGRLRSRGTPELRDLLVVLAGSDESTGRHHWWHAYRGVLPPTYRDFISLESQASEMRTLETSVVPGLLQTPEYARAVTRAAARRAGRTSRWTPWSRCGWPGRTCCDRNRRWRWARYWTRRCCGARSAAPR